jgi:hypothetical protein
MEVEDFENLVKETWSKGCSTSNPIDSGSLK